MRPKKIILCVDDNEQDLSVRKFMLTTNGYRVLAATNAEEALAMFAEAQVDLVLADYSMSRMNGAQLIAKLKEQAYHVPMILLAEPQQIGNEQHRADAVIARRNASPQELLERIKIMSTRKRGPRKGTHRVQPQAQEYAAAS